jgi:ABC-type transport system involved in multi-copper enzyme maturation permease subunit
MSSTVFWRLVWKEYRAQRPFWIAMVVLNMLVQAYIFAMTPSGLIPSLLFTAAVAMTAFYAWGCGATLFATEHETGTFDYLRSLPVSARLVFTSKIACSLLCVLAFGIVLWAIAAVTTRCSCLQENLQSGFVWHGAASQGWSS